MVMIVERHDLLEAWKAAAMLVVNAPAGGLKDLVVSFAAHAVDDAALAPHDPFRRDGDRLSDVANTIFPLKSHANSNSRDDFYRRYLRAHRRSRTKRWGTYFQRLIAFGPRAINQLENGISAITEWQNTPRNAICWHLSSPELDAIRPLGAPCLQMIQVHCHDTTVDFSVAYRNHDYFNKALGNFLGLNRLLDFVATEVGRRPGEIVCYSMHAYSAKSKAALTQLVG